MAPSTKLHDTDHVRNVALVGHAGAGKTALLEALLAKTGAIRSAGSIARSKANRATTITRRNSKSGQAISTIQRARYSEKSRIRSNSLQRTVAGEIARWGSGTRKVNDRANGKARIPRWRSIWTVACPSDSDKPCRTLTCLIRSGGVAISP